jgi:hypothetical protein
MATHVHSFMKSILGEDGQQAFDKMIKRAPGIGVLLAPRTILGWISTASRINYEGELPGVNNSYVSLSKSEDGIHGAVAVEGVQHTFEGHDLVHVAAAISQALGVESIDIDPSVRDTDLSKLGKSIDLLVKARTIAHVAEEEMSKFALAPTKMTQHGAYHIVHTPGQKYPYSIHHTGTGERVQSGIATLQNAQVIAKWHASRPMVKTEPPGQAAAPRPPLEQQPGPTPQATQPVVNKPPMQKSTRRELMVKHEDAERPCQICGQQLFKSQQFVGCLCFRSVAKSVQTRDTQNGFVLQFNRSELDDDTLQTLISTFRR